MPMQSQDLARVDDVFSKICRTVADLPRRFLLAVVFLSLTSCGGSDTEQPVVQPPAPSKPISGTGRIVLGVDPTGPVSAAASRFNLPEDAVEAPDGSIYVADTQAHVIRRIRDGMINIVAGSFQSGYNGDGVALSTSLNLPIALLMESNGTGLIFSDAGNSLLRRLDFATNRITTLAGETTKRSVPVSGMIARGNSIGYVTTLRYDDFGNIWFVATDNAETYAYGIFYLRADGIIIKYNFNYPTQQQAIRDVLAHDGVVDILHDTLFTRIQPNGTMQTISLRSNFGKGLAKTDGGVLIADHTALMKVTNNFDLLYEASGFANITNIKPNKSGFIITDSDQGVIFSYKSSSLRQLVGIEMSSFGAFTGVTKFGNDLLALDNQRGQIWRIDTITGSKEIWAGKGTSAPAVLGVQRLDATFYYPNSIVADASGNVYIAEQNRIIRIDSQGMTSLYAGADVPGDAVGPALDARFTSIGAMSFDRAGNLYVCDSYNNRIKRITPEGLVTSFAGTGRVGQTVYGSLAAQTPLNRPMGVLAMDDGSILIADSWSNAVSRVGTDGIIRGFAGKLSPQGYQGFGTFSGDGGSAQAAGFNNPVAMSVGIDGTVYVVDQFNHRIRRVYTNDTVDTFAGSAQGFAPGGKLLNFPTAAFAIGDKLYVADGGNRLIWEYQL